MRFAAALCAGLMVTGLGVEAQERDTLGVGRLFNNDYFGDFDDRWRTGSYSISVLRGTDWSGEAATQPGAILEYRLRTEIIAPQRLNGPLSGDRPYVGALSFGLHTHFARGEVELSTGVDLVAIGPQTGLANFQDSFHGLISAPNVSDDVEANQVGNAVYPTAVAQAVYPVQWNGGTQIRPFVELQYGVEDIARLGVDVLIGRAGQNDLWVRDSTTGQLYAGIEGQGVGTSFAFGMDYTMVADSAYFPESFGTQAEDGRLRVRGGIHARMGEGMSMFYGATYLSEEYVGQDGGQIVGSVKLNFNF